MVCRHKPYLLSTMVDDHHVPPLQGYSYWLIVVNFLTIRKKYWHFLAKYNDNDCKEVCWQVVNQKYTNNSALSKHKLTICFYDSTNAQDDGTGKFSQLLMGPWCSKPTCCDYNATHDRDTGSNRRPAFYGLRRWRRWFVCCIPTAVMDGELSYYH